MSCLLISKLPLLNFTDELSRTSGLLCDDTGLVESKKPMRFGALAMSSSKLAFEFVTINSDVENNCGTESLAFKSISASPSSSLPALLASGCEGPSLLRCSAIRFSNFSETLAADSGVNALSALSGFAVASLLTVSGQLLNVSCASLLKSRKLLLVGGPPNAANALVAGVFCGVAGSKIRCGIAVGIVDGITLVVDVRPTDDGGPMICGFSGNFTFAGVKLIEGSEGNGGGLVFTGLSIDCAFGGVTRPLDTSVVDSGGPTFSGFSGGRLCCAKDPANPSRLKGCC